MRLPHPSSNPSPEKDHSIQSRSSGVGGVGNHAGLKLGEMRGARGRYEGGRVGKRGVMRGGGLYCQT